MPCPTCDGTMQAIGCKVTDTPFFWCPRCGTIKPCQEAEAVAPDLVRRCQRFEAASPHSVLWCRLGIEESIHPPEERPAVRLRQEEAALTIGDTATCRTALADPPEPHQWKAGDWARFVGSDAVVFALKKGHIYRAQEVSAYSNGAQQLRIREADDSFVPASRFEYVPPAPTS